MRQRFHKHGWTRVVTPVAFARWMGYNESLQGKAMTGGLNTDIRGFMDHDQVFKELLRTFFREFMELFFPHVAARLDFERVTFLDKETFTDLPHGEQREADLVAQVYTLNGQPEIILTHIEVEARRRRTMPERMHEYYMMLRLRHHVPVYPIVIYLSPGAGGLTTEQHEERVFDEQVDLFSYRAVGLPDLLADDYQESEYPLGPALSALMKPSRLGSVVQGYRSLRAMALAQMDDAKKALLTNIIETYLPLKPEEQERLRSMIAAPEGKEIQEMISVYEQRGIEKGIEKGIEQGIEQGIEKGKRDSLLRLLRHRFADLPDQFLRRIEAIKESSELDRLFDRAVDISTLEDLGLPEA